MPGIVEPEGLRSRLPIGVRRGTTRVIPALPMLNPAGGRGMIWGGGFYRQFDFRDVAGWDCAGQGEELQ